MMEKAVNTSQDLYMAEGIGTYFQILQQAAF